MIRATFQAVIFVGALTTVAQTDPVKTVSAAEATNHIVHRVEPTVPPLAKAVKIGDKVKLHVVVSVDPGFPTGWVFGAQPVRSSLCERSGASPQY